MTDLPDFIDGRAFLIKAYEVAFQAHHGPEREGDTDIDHPTAVARLLDGTGFGEEIVAAAFLHDVVEDTERGLDQIEDDFGPEVRGLVEVMTENDEIADYEDRKAEHRVRVVEAGAGPASIYLADKLARVRAYLASGEPVQPRRLEHYWDTLELFAVRRPELPFLSELAAEMPQLVQADEDD
jgi:guanosine-3',5'-bis(diphosphate) 3'-pyrophosphohydrolase